ncbi:hypothetical protein BJ912DRAFT_953140 [Pholiota molesta]|nr:hypothetical protein BJ912DRAFT_953140 [Pholiota molesta]
MQAIQRHIGQISVLHRAYQENGRCLQISPLYRLRNDVRWGFSQFGLNADAAKIEQQRSKEYDQLVAELRAYLNPAVSSFARVTSVRWDIMAARDDDESIAWYQADIISALSTIPGLTRLGLMVYNEDYISAASVFGKNNSKYGTDVAAYAFGDSDLGFCAYRLRRFLAVYEDFKHKARVVDRLHSLSFQLASPRVSNTIIHGETAPDVLFSYLFHVALPQHHRSLKNLRLPNIDPDLI